MAAEAAVGGRTHQTPHWPQTSPETRVTSAAVTVVAVAAAARKASLSCRVVTTPFVRSEDLTNYNCTYIFEESTLTYKTYISNIERQPLNWALEL